MSDSGCGLLQPPDSALFSPSIQPGFPCLPKFCLAIGPKKFLYSLMVITAHRGDSHVSSRSLLSMAGDTGNAQSGAVPGSSGEANNCIINLLQESRGKGLSYMSSAHFSP